MKKLFVTIAFALAFWGCTQAQSSNKASAEESSAHVNAVHTKQQPEDSSPAAESSQKTENSKPAETTDLNPVPSSDAVAPVPSSDAVAPVPSSDAVAPVPVVESPQPKQAVVHDGKTVAPLSPEHHQRLSAITWDLPPEILDAVKEQHEGKHFLFSDEKHPELFYDSIQNLGGTYIGIGTDQGYLFTGWQRPELAFLVDYDPWVVILHHIYMAFWRTCADSACLLDHFDDRKKGNTLLMSQEVLAKFASYGLKDRKLISKVYRTANRNVARALRRIQAMKLKTFMNDPETFQYIKSLIENDRLRSFQANLLGDLAFKSVAETLKSMNMSVTTLYLSNAEQYWGYTPQFKRNILGLPVSDKSLIMRTSATYPHNQDYRYSIQPMHVFRAWLEHPRGRSVKAVTQRVPVEHPEHFPFVIDDKMPKPQ